DRVVLPAEHGRALGGLFLVLLDELVGQLVGDVPGAIGVSVLDVDAYGEVLRGWNGLDLAAQLLRRDVQLELLADLLGQGTAAQRGGVLIQEPARVSAMYSLALPLPPTLAPASRTT